MEDFLKNNMELIGILGAFIIGWFLPNPKLKAIGRKIGEKLPGKLRNTLAEKIHYFEDGLKEETSDNENVMKTNTKNLNIDLELGKSASAKETGDSQ